MICGSVVPSKLRISSADSSTERVSTRYVLSLSCIFFPFLRCVLLHIFVQMLVLGKLINKFVNKTQNMNFFEDRYFKKFKYRLMSRKQARIHEFYN